MTSPSAALALWTAEAVRATLAPLGTVFERQGERLVHAGGFVAVVDADCTVLAPALWLLGALAVFGAVARVPWRRCLAGALGGVVVLAIANQLRLAAVLWAGAHAPAHFGWLHDVAGPLWLVAVGAGIVGWAVRGAAAPGAA
jgi:exosortase/archaeosortase family protein